MEQQERSRQTILIVLGSLIFILGLSSLILFFQNRLLSQQIATTQTSPSPTPTASTDPTADWETYNSKGVSFKFPPQWKSSDNKVSSEDNQISIYVFEKDEPMTNECMEIKNTKTENGLQVNYYSHVQGTEACSNQETWNEREIWITKAGGDGFQPGIIFYYKAGAETTSVQYFDQILSTFKFTGTTTEKPTITSPITNSIVTSPLTVSGTAPAGWMFEGQLNLKVLDSTRKVIGQSAGKEKAPGSWQSGKPVGFTGTATFATSDTTGFLVIEADNPSGLPENAKSYEVPIKFK